MKISDEAAMLEYGRQLGADFLRRLEQQGTTTEKTDGKTSPNAAIVIELLGDVGAGKTTLTRGIAAGLGVKTPVTSPSFTISKRYAFKNGTLIHYDFYRLPDPGLMVEDLSESLSAPNSVVILEWADTVQGILPENHLRIRIRYNDDGSRDLETEETR